MGGVDPSQLGFPFEVDHRRFSKEPGIAFKQTPHGELLLDAYRPTDAIGPSPLVVMIHGGGWRGGGRYQIEMTDVDPDTVEIGGRVEMTFRRLYTADGIHDYFWKARPLVD